MSSVSEIGSILSVASEWLEFAAGVIDLIAIAILMIGAVRFVVMFARAEFTGPATERRVEINHARCVLGTYILSGLELAIVSDAIHTAVTRKLDDLIVLGALVIIRSVMSFFLERELKTLQAPNEERTAG